MEYIHTYTCVRRVCLNNLLILIIYVHRQVSECGFLAEISYRSTWQNYCGINRIWMECMYLSNRPAQVRCSPNNFKQYVCSIENISFTMLCRSVSDVHTIPYTNWALSSPAVASKTNGNSLVQNRSIWQLTRGALKILFSGACEVFLNRYH